MRPDDELLTPAEVADLCKVTRTTVFRWASDGEIHAIRLGKRVVRFRRGDVEQFISKAAS